MKKKIWKSLTFIIQLFSLFNDVQLADTEGSDWRSAQIFTHSSPTRPFCQPPTDSSFFHSPFFYGSHNQSALFTDKQFGSVMKNASLPTGCCCYLLFVGQGWRVSGVLVPEIHESSASTKATLCVPRLFPLREQGLNFYAHELTQDEIKVGQLT